jgi:hypothetical protein
MRGGKHYFSVVRDEASPKFDRKSPSSTSLKTNGVKRKIVRRPKKFETDDWYKKAVLSMKISGEP